MSTSVQGWTADAVDSAEALVSNIFEIGTRLVFFWAKQFTFFAIINCILKIMLVTNKIYLNFKTLNG